MPSNNDLITDIETTAKAKGVDIPDTNGTNNIQLAEILKNLKTVAPAPDDALEKAAAETDPTDNATDETGGKPEVKKPPFYIKDGKSLTCKKGKNGMINEGEEIKAEWLPGGKTRIAELITLGVVAKG